MIFCFEASDRPGGDRPGGRGFGRGRGDREGGRGGDREGGRGRGGGRGGPKVCIGNTTQHKRKDRKMILEKKEIVLLTFLIISERWTQEGRRHWQLGARHQAGPSRQGAPDQVARGCVLVFFARQGVPDCRDLFA